MALGYGRVGTNNFGTAKYIVDTNGISTGATHSTIAAALTSASSGETIFVRPGTYTENLTLKAGVNLASFDCDALTPNVTIIGKCTFTAAGTVSISGIRLQTNSDFLLAVTGTLASVVNLKDCYLNISNNTGISFTSTSASSAINITDCNGNIGTTGIAFIAHSATGTLTVNNGYFTNSGASTTASTLSGSGSWNMYYTYFTNPVTSSGTANGFTFFKCFLQTSGTNTTTITHGCTNASGPSIIDSWLASGTASAISISASCNLTLTKSTIQSSNTNAITGSGTISYMDLVFSGTSAKINTTTQTGGVAKGGLTQAPSAGFIGEQLSSAATNVSLSNGTDKTVTSISVTAGIWDISAIGYFGASGSNITDCKVGISTTTNTITGNPGDQYARSSSFSVNTFTMSVPVLRATLTSTTTYYIIQTANFAAGTVVANGRITATRVG